MSTPTPTPTLTPGTALGEHYSTMSEEEKKMLSEDLDTEFITPNKAYDNSVTTFSFVEAEKDKEKKNNKDSSFSR